MDVGQAKVPAGVSIGELLVVEAEEAQDSRVKVMDVNLILDCLVAQLVRGAVDVPPLDPTAGHPHAEAVMVMVAAVGLGVLGVGVGELNGRRAAEFAPPEDKGLFE